MTLGDAESGEWSSPLACDDVLAHEIAHGYVRYLATLRYGLTEAGAIIEHLCDAFAWFVTREQAPPAAGDWTIGRGFPVRQGALRDLGNPAAAGLRIPAAPHRDAMKAIGKQEDLYFNAGVLGKAFATAVTAAGQARVDAVATVWFKLAERLPEAGTFALFRDEAVRAADEDSADLGAVVRGAFTAVGF